MFAIPLPENAELRALEPWRAEEFLAHLDRARTHIAPWVGAGFVATDLEGARAVLRDYADGQAADRKRLYGIWFDGVLVGGTMFVSFDATSGVCEIGCWLEPAGQGHGLITRTVRTMIDWAFHERGLARAEWRTLPDNVRSIAVAKRLGMSLDGTMRRQSARGDGQRHDLQVWSVLATEWPDAARCRGSAPGAGGAEGVEDSEDAGGVEGIEGIEGIEGVEGVEGVEDVKAELDRLTHAFLGAFTTVGGVRPDVDAMREVFIPQGTIINNAGDEPVVYDLDAFIDPREKILTDGTLTEFSEWEVAERTEIFGSIAHRFSEYRKSGIRLGERFEGGGRKTFQFVRTPDGWRMSSMAWDDVRL